MVSRMNQKIDCDVVLDLLPLYHDDVVSETSQKLVSEHLEQCTSCKKEYEQISTTLVGEIQSTKEQFTRMMNARRKRIKISIGLVVALVFFFWFFSHSFTPEQAFKNLEKKYAQLGIEFELIDSISLEKDEVFFVLFSDSMLKSPDMASVFVKRHGIFYETDFFSHSSTNKFDDTEQYNFHISHRESGENSYNFMIASSWGAVDSMEYDGNLAERVELENCVLFYGVSTSDTTAFPIAYDTENQVVDPHLREKE